MIFLTHISNGRWECSNEYKIMDKKNEISKYNHKQSIKCYTKAESPLGFFSSASRVLAENYPFIFFMVGTLSLELPTSASIAISCRQCLIFYLVRFIQNHPITNQFWKLLYIFYYAFPFQLSYLTFFPKNIVFNL